MRLVRRLWTEETVTYEGEHFQVADSTVEPRFHAGGGRRHPKLYFGGASEAAERVSATEADIQLFWGEPLDGVRERIHKLQALSKELDRDLPPLEFELRITTFVRDTTEQAWAEAEAKVAGMARNKEGTGTIIAGPSRLASSGCWTCTHAAMCWTTISIPRRASSVAAAPERHGWSAPQRRSQVP